MGRRPAAQETLPEMHLVFREAGFTMELPERHATSRAGRDLGAAFELPLEHDPNTRTIRIAAVPASSFHSDLFCSQS